MVYNYDADIKEVVGRTYANLYQGTLTYTYDGKDIFVNQDKPILVEVGSYTDEILVTMNYPAEKAITLQKQVQNSDISIIPLPVHIPLGESLAAFRIGAPTETLLKSFYITWYKTGDDLENPYYSPLRLTEI